MKRTRHGPAQIIAKLRDAGRSPEEKALLATLGDAGLAVLRDSAVVAVSFRGK